MAESSADILEQVRGIHLPPAPPEPPLWPLAIATIVIVCGVLLCLIDRLRIKKWHHEALAELGKIQHLQEDKKLVELSRLLRRIVLTGNNSVAARSLTGRAWLDQLDVFFNTRYFSTEDGRVFGADLYRRSQYTDETTNHIIKKIRQLIRYKARFSD